MVVVVGGGETGAALEGDADDGALSLDVPDADDASVVAVRSAIAVAGDARREAVAGAEEPLGLTRRARAFEMSQCGVSVVGFIRPRTAAVHSVDEPGPGAALGGLREAVAADGHRLAGLEAPGRE